MALTPEDIRDLKEAFGPIFRVKKPTQVYTCRTITRAEAKAVGLMDREPDFRMENDIFMLAVIDPGIESVDQLNEIPSSDVPDVVNVILEKSGMLSPAVVNEKASMARQQVNLDVYTTISAIIIATFGPEHYSFDELDSMDIDSLMVLLARAEKLNEVRDIINSGGYEPVRFAEIDDTAQEGTPAAPEGSDSDKDAEIRRKLAEGAMKAGILDGSFQQQSFGIQDRYDNSGRKISGMEFERP